MFMLCSINATGLFLEISAAPKLKGFVEFVTRETRTFRSKPAMVLCRVKIVGEGGKQERERFFDSKEGLTVPVST